MHLIRPRLSSNVSKKKKKASLFLKASLALIDGSFSEADVCELDSLTVHWLAAAAAEGTCVSSDCRQLTVSLTSVFSKLYVISEAEEDGDGG